MIFVSLFNFLIFINWGLSFLLNCIEYSCQKDAKFFLPPLRKLLPLENILQEGEGKAEYLIIVKERLVLKFTPYLPYESFFSSEADLLNFIMGIFREGGGGHVYPPPDLINQGHMLHGSTCLLFLLLCS